MEKWRKGLTTVHSLELSSSWTAMGLSGPLGVVCHLSWSLTVAAVTGIWGNCCTQLLDYAMPNPCYALQIAPTDAEDCKEPWGQPSIFLLQRAVLRLRLRCDLVACPLAWGWIVGKMEPKCHRAVPALPCISAVDFVQLLPSLLSWRCGQPLVFCSGITSED